MFRFKERTRIDRMPDSYEMRNNIWLAERIQALSKTQTGLAKLLGVARGAVTGIVNGTRDIKAAEVQIIADYLEWPAGRVLAMISDPSALPLNLDPHQSGLTRIPVIGAVEAGAWREALEYVPDEDQPYVEVPPDPRYPGARRFALQVRGPSMNLVYPEGSHVIVVPAMDLGEGWQAADGQRVIVQRMKDAGEVEATVKEFKVGVDGSAWLWPRSDNPSFQQPWRVPDSWHGNGDFDEHSDNLRITGLVVQSLRNEP